MFDNDDTLAYEPASTAAVILTGGDEEAEAAALAVKPFIGYKFTPDLCTTKPLYLAHLWSILLTCCC